MKKDIFRLKRPLNSRKEAKMFLKAKNLLVFHKEKVQKKVRKMKTPREKKKVMTNIQSSKMISIEKETFSLIQSRRS